MVHARIRIHVGVAMLALALLPWPSVRVLAEDTWVVVTKVVDGDTIRAGALRIRLIGVDAPEIPHDGKSGQYFGGEATGFTAQALMGKRVRLQRNPGDETDAYGRLLAFVFLEDGSMFNRELLRQGYARALTRFPFAYADEFRHEEQEARRSGRGMWAITHSASDSASKIIGNRRSMVYHLPGQEHYADVTEPNRVYFETEDEARRLGYRPAKK